MLSGIATAFADSFDDVGGVTAGAIGAGTGAWVVLGVLSRSVAGGVMASGRAVLDGGCSVGGGVG